MVQEQMSVIGGLGKSAERISRWYITIPGEAMDFSVRWVNPKEAIARAGDAGKKKNVSLRNLKR